MMQVPKAGHFALVEIPDAVTIALRDWLTSSTRPT